MPTMVHSEGTRPGAARLAQDGLRCAFAGVEFDLSGAGLRDFSPPPVCAEYVSEAGAYPTVAHVSCDLVTDASLGKSMFSLRSVSWSHRADGGCHITGGYMVADLARLGPRHYGGVVRVAADPWGAAACLRFIAAALVEAHGGLNLHAASIDIDGYAIAFSGPSGAGKSTACDLAQTAHCLGYDQLAVYPSEDGYMAWALPWGKSTQLSRSAACARPLGAVLRVRQSTGQPRIIRADAATALFVLREAATVSESGVEAEQRRLNAALSLAERVTVGHIETVLGQPIDALIRDEVGASGERPASVNAHVVERNP